MEHRDQRMESVLRATDDLVTVSAVYADWLHEKGDALGEHLARALRGLPVEPSRWLGPLDELVDQGALELSFTAGWVTGARFVRAPRRTEPPVSVEAKVSALLGSRLALPLRALEVRCRETGVEASAVLEALLEHRAIALRTLSLGPRFDTEGGLDGALVHQLRALAPGLTGTPDDWRPVRATYAVKVLRAPSGHPARTGALLEASPSYYLPEGTLVRRGKYFVLTPRRPGALVGRAGGQRGAAATLVQPGQSVELDVGDTVELDSGLVLSPVDCRL